MQKQSFITSDVRVLLPGLCLLTALLLLLLSNTAAQNPSSSSATPDNAAIGIDFYQKGNFEVAITRLRQAVKKQNKDDPVAWNYLGLAWLKQHELKEARKAFEKAVKLNPNNEAWRINLAYAWLQTGETKKALKEAEQVIRKNAKNADAQYLFGEIRLRENKSSEALEKARTVLAINPNYAAAWLLKAQALIRIWYNTRSASPSVFVERTGADESSRNEKRRLLREATDDLEHYLKLIPETDSARRWRSVMEGLRTFLEIYGKPAEEQNVFDLSESGVIRPILIYKEKAKYTEEARQSKTAGIVLLLVLINTDGLAKPLVVVQGLPYGLTENAVEAASKMRFQSAMKNGKPVAVIVPVEFAFSIF